MVSVPVVQTRGAGVASGTTVGNAPGVPFGEGVCPGTEEFQPVGMFDCEPVVVLPGIVGVTMVDVGATGGEAECP